MGVRFGTSTRAFLNTDVILRSYDVFIDEKVSELFQVAKKCGKNVEYIKSDVREIEIDETDILFIDTWHCYDQLKTELKLHHHKVKKYIIFHDTHTYGVKGEESEIGLLPAIIEFLIEFPEWKFILHKINNNGLTIIEKKNNNQKLLQKIKIKTDIEKLLTNYALNPENPETNFQLGIWYEREGHTAPALSYFLRCAEREKDIDIQYLALIKCYYCYDRQGTRDGTSKSLLLHAITILPKRPEAHFLLSRFYEKRNDWSECYACASLALEVCDFDCEPLLVDVEYPGKYGLLFEKAISGWWWGKTEESKSLFVSILNDYDNIKPLYIESIKKNLNLFENKK
jgi:tetratricopeptide (TPR) repeat protein